MKERGRVYWTDYPVFACRGTEENEGIARSGMADDEDRDSKLVSSKYKTRNFNGSASALADILYSALCS